MTTSTQPNTDKDKEAPSSNKKSKPENTNSDKSKSTKTSCKTLTKRIQSMDDWSAQIESDWSAIKQAVDKMQFTGRYNALVAMMLYPIYPKNRTELKSLLKILNNIRYGKPLATYLDDLFKSNKYKLSLKDCVQKHLSGLALSVELSQSLDWLLVATRTIVIASEQDKDFKNFIPQLLDELRKDTRITAGVRVEAEMLSANGNLAIAGRDVNIVTTHYGGKKSYLLHYLTRVSAEWDFFEIGNTTSSQTTQVTNGDLHKLFTPMDVWDSREYSNKQGSELTEARFEAIEQKELEAPDGDEARRSLIEIVAASPYVVVTGGPGTGKSAFCRYMGTCLANACKQGSKIDGLALLGSAWVHGAILPIYVKLRQFCADKIHFPQNSEKATSQSLLDYLVQSLDKFGTQLEDYLLNDNVPTEGTLLLLDGLDEVYKEEDRLFLQAIIHNWIKRFPKCRIIVTSRTYAYHHDAKWRLSDKFKAVELAPYSWQQIQAYVNNWYSQAAASRPHLFDGRQAASEITQQLAKDLIHNIKETQSLWALARQPLMLAMLTLLHETNRELPDKRAKLYAKTVSLLDHWNTSSNQQFTGKFKTLDRDRVRHALHLVAYKLHCQQETNNSYPASIDRKELLHIFDQQNQRGNGLGVAIEDVIDYLSTRNGILLSDNLGLYRFPHLSIQEYLAACALIDLFDEVTMPKGLKPNSSDGWVFPTNLSALINHEPQRWRNVALFAGSIIAAESGQNRRWALIEAILPEIVPPFTSEGYQTSVIVAAEIWAESYLPTRLPSERATKNRLIEALQVLIKDYTLDLPENEIATSVLQQLLKS